MKKPTKEQLEQDVLSDKPWSEIAQKYGYTDARYLRKLSGVYGLPKRRVYLKPDKITLEKMILTDKLTPKEIADKLGYGEGGWSNVYAYCREYGIEFDYSANAELRNTDFSEEQKSIIVGTVIADAYLRPSNQREETSYSLCIAHGKKQKAYLEWKKTKLSPFILADEPYEAKLSSSFAHDPVFHYHTIAHPWLTEKRKQFYPNGVKTVSKEWLNEINELSLAVWFMDDGSLNTKTGAMTFCTNAFSYEGHEIMQKWFNDRWSIATVIEPRRNNQFNLRINVSVAHKLREIIRPHVPECMSYKVNF